MGEISTIQWTDATWNPWHGCIKISPGCKNCYMYRDKHRWNQDPSIVTRAKDGTFNAPLKWKEPRKIFACSWSDFFIEHADSWRSEAWEIIKATPQHTYQILTKRPERIEKNLPIGEDLISRELGLPCVPRNCMIGISAENKDEFNARWPVLEGLHSPMKRFLSLEPLLGPIPSLRDWIEPCFDEERDMHYPDWVIIGGESGSSPNSRWSGYRPCELEWIEEIVDTCKEFEVPVFVKQLGTHLAKAMGLKDHHGGDINEFPEHLKIRQFPNG